MPSRIVEIYLEELGGLLKAHLFISRKEGLGLDRQSKGMEVIAP